MNHITFHDIDNYENELEAANEYNDGIPDQLPEDYDSWEDYFEDQRAAEETIANGDF